MCGGVNMPKWTSEEDARLRNLVKLGYNFREIHERIQTHSYRAISMRANQQGLHIVSKQEQIIKLHHEDKTLTAQELADITNCEVANVYKVLRGEFRQNSKCKDVLAYLKATEQDKWEDEIELTKKYECSLQTVWKAKRLYRNEEE